MWVKPEFENSEGAQMKNTSELCTATGISSNSDETGKQEQFSSVFKLQNENITS